uniref:Cytochrome P450 n=1 Tax=Gongylonema pulchrum TaxID=637853 RepID=A0A183D7T6_9BILA
LSRVAPRVPETIPRLIGRIITKLRRDGDTHAAFNGRLFSSLKSHVDDVEKDEKKRTGFAMIMHVMKDYFVPAKFPPKEEIFEIFCKTFWLGS